jgi:hypothetical protein
MYDLYHWPYLTMALGELRSQSAISPYEEEEEDLYHYFSTLKPKGKSEISPFRPQSREIDCDPQ